jgi:hypothetical protein
VPNVKSKCTTKSKLHLARHFFARSIGLMIMLFICGASPVWGLELTLNWQESVDPDVKGYVLHYGHSSGEYSNTVNVGKSTSHTLRDLDDGSDYYFSVTSYGDNGEGESSEEIYYSPSILDRPPVVQDMDLNIENGTPCSSLLDGSDADGNQLDYFLVTPPSNGVVAIEDVHTGAFSYAPHEGATGTDSFVFAAYDGVQTSNLGTVMVNIMNEEPQSETGGPGHKLGTGGSIENAGTGEEVIAAINVGGDEVSDENGVLYQADAHFSGGTTAATSAAVDCTADDALYQTARFGDFGYNIPVPNGDYIVTLKFAETDWETAGKRLFNVNVENRPVASGLDIVSNSGTFVPLDLHIPVTVEDSSLDISLLSIQDQAKLNAILVRRSPQRVVCAINAGGQRFTSSNGIVYSSDASCAGGVSVSQRNPIYATDDDRLYQTSRVGNFSYDMAVANGDYLVTLKFAETFWNLENKRVFDVFVDGEEVESDLDLFAHAGKDVAFDITHSVKVLDGRLNISFRSDLGRALLCGVLVQAVN